MAIETTAFIEDAHNNIPCILPKYFVRSYTLPHGRAEKEEEAIPFSSRVLSDAKCGLHLHQVPHIPR